MVHFLGACVNFYNFLIQSVLWYNILQCIGKKEIRFYTLKFIAALCEKCPNMEFFLVRIFPYSVRIREHTDQKKLRIWTLFTQCRCKENILCYISYWTHRFSSIKHVRNYSRCIKQYYKPWHANLLNGSSSMQVVTQGQRNGFESGGAMDH